MVPKKKKGFRKLVTDNKIYYWRLNGIVEIRPDQNQTNKLEIDFGYFDYWEFTNFRKPFFFFGTIHFSFSYNLKADKQ